MAIPESRRRANDKYNATCDYISVRPKLEEGAEIRQAAADAGESLQGYILRACKQRMEREERAVAAKKSADE